ncbi:hypothetical protein MP228_003093 [Amoeboaphelidium protococcarum]|nr:hypothetical protein MP228_003093 [Amoeboaphelidium protococcarum]
MDEEYDVVVLGTGLTECILSGLLSIEKKKVLHMDRNNYYGAECASLNLSQMYQQFKADEFTKMQSKVPSVFGRERDFNLDLVPKFIMANSDLVTILTRTDVTRYLEFKQIAGSYVYRSGKIYKVPATAMEAASSGLMGFFEKGRCKSFFTYLQNYKQEDMSTWQGMDLNTVTMREVFKYFGLETGTQDYVGHALALYLDDNYLDLPAKETHERIKLYVQSLSRYGKSPYIYPMYGLGELPQGFARLAAIYGGTYMLDKKVDEIVYEGGKVVGVRSGDEVAKCKAVICDPSYALTKCQKTGRIIRVICLLDHPIPNTGDVDSVQIIVPQGQVPGRKSDMYIACVSAEHCVAGKGWWVAIASCSVESSNPEAEIQVALNLLGPIKERFVSIVDQYEPLESGVNDNLFITKSYDATSHFETVVHDLKNVYQRYSGQPLSLDQNVRQSVEEEQKAMSQNQQ